MDFCPNVWMSLKSTFLAFKKSGTSCTNWGKEGGLFGQNPKEQQLFFGKPSPSDWLSDIAMMIGLGSDKNVSESALKTFWGKSSEMLIFHQRRENLSAQKDNFGGSSQDIFLFAILSIISSCHCSPLLQYFQLESASLFNSDEIIDVFAKFSSILFVIASSRNLLRYWYYSASREFSHHCFPTPTKCIIAFHNVNQKGSKMNNT